MSTKYTMVAGGLIAGGASLAMVIWTPVTFLAACLLIGGGIAMFMLRGTQRVAKWADDLTQGVKEPEFDFELKGGWDKDGRKH